MPKKVEEQAPAPAKKKKEESKIPTRAQLLDAVMAGVNKEFKGQGVIDTAENTRNVFILRRPLGILSLDIALGGGLPAGGLSQIIGKEGVGKDYLINRAVANTQQIYGPSATVALCQTEMKWDKPYAKWFCGVQVAFSDNEIADLEVAQARAYTEDEKIWLRHQVGTIHHVMAANAEKLLEQAVTLVESNLYQIVVINSFGALLTKAEAEAEKGLEDKHRGGAAMVVTQFMHRLHAALNLPDQFGRPNMTTVIGINQYRDNVGGGLYANPMNIAGGHALKHGKLVDLHIERGAYQNIELKGGGKEAVGKEINWHIIKGKAGCHDGPRGSYWFYFGKHGYPTGADTLTDLVVTAAVRGVIEQSGAWFSYKNERLGQGKENAAMALYNNSQLAETIRKETLVAAEIRCIFNEQQMAGIQAI